MFRCDLIINYLYFSDLFSEIHLSFLILNLSFKKTRDKPERILRTGLSLLSYLRLKKGTFHITLIAIKTIKAQANLSIVNNPTVSIFSKAMNPFNISSTVSRLIGPSNWVLLLLSHVISIPVQYTTVPSANSTASRCRIYQSALSQRDCGACAAFAVAALVSMQTCLYEDEDFIPSPFRIFDCSNSTCESGVPIFRAAAIANFGIGDLRDSEEKFGLQCDFRWENHKRRRLGITGLFIDDPMEIKAALLLFGPLLGTIRFPIYRNIHTGAYMFSNGGKKVDDTHAVVIVGWDEASNWIVQNSWGDEWGDGKGRGRLDHGALVRAFDPSVTMINWVLLTMLLISISMLFYVGILEKTQRRAK